MQQTIVLDPADAGSSLSASVSCGNAGHRELIACAGCDLLHVTEPLPPGSTAVCRRCGHRLYSHRVRGIDNALALTFASSVFFLLANTFPFMAIEVQGVRQEISILSAALELFRQGMPELGIFASAVIFVFPLLQLIGMLMVLTPLRQGRTTHLSRQALRIVSMLAPWSMMEIYLLGVLVSLVKLATLADVTLGIAFWNFAALVTTNIWAAVSIDRYCLWQHLDDSR